MKKVWCKHVRYYSWTTDGNKRYCWEVNSLMIPKSWKYCPICKTKRPK